MTSLNHSAMLQGYLVLRTGAGLAGKGALAGIGFGDLCMGHAYFRI